MEHFIAYHSAERMGYEYEPTEHLRFLSKKLSSLKRALGNTVWVVQGFRKGSGTAYALCGTYIADQVERENAASDRYVIRGNRITEFSPPVALNGFSWFPALLKSQSNFSLGFNRLSDESLIQALLALQSTAAKLSTGSSLPDIDLSISATEGNARLVSHLRRERNRALIEAKRAATLQSNGTLRCEACGFDFSVTYGSFGDGFCEVHHLVPLSASTESVTTSLDDLAVLCSNCHRIIHRSMPMLSVAELSKVINRGRP